MRDILDVLNLGVAFLRSSCVIYIYIYICKYESKAMAQCIEVLYFFRLRFL